MSFEGQKDLDVEFGDIVPSDGSESSYGHVYALVVGDCSPRFTFRRGHCGDAEGRVFQGEMS